MCVCEREREREEGMHNIQYLIAKMSISQKYYTFTIIQYVVMGDLSFPEYRFTYHFR